MGRKRKMQLVKVCRKFDNWCGDVHQRIVGTFTGKVFAKLISEIVLACLIAAAVYMATEIYNDSRAASVDNENLSRIYISVSDEYVDSLFGTPYIEVGEQGDLMNHFYLLQDAVLRTVSEDDKVIAYFITSTDPRRKIPVDTFEEGKRIIGKMKYSAVDFPNPTVVSNITMNGRYVYYYEMQGTGRYGMFNSYLYGTAPYGFIDEGSADLIHLTAWGEDYSKEEYQKMRSATSPNTFGVIADGYEDVISIIPTCEEWENMYYLLNK